MNFAIKYHKLFLLIPKLNNIYHFSSFCIVPIPLEYSFYQDIYYSPSNITAIFVFSFKQTIYEEAEKP